MDRENRF